MSGDPKTTGTLEQRLTHYSTEALPNSIKNISENSKNLTPVIEYLEQAYLTAADQEAQAEVETQAKTYLADALSAVVGDINDIAHNLEQFVGLQVEAVDGLSTQMELLRTKMTLYKEQHGTEKFSTFRDQVETPSGAYSRKVGGEDEGKEGSGEELKHSARLITPLLPGVSLMNELTAEEERVKMTHKNRHSSRVPLQERLSRLDDVGVCLDKETDKQSAMASAVAKSSVLRRSSYNKANPNRRASQHADDNVSLASTLPSDDDDDMSVSTQGSRVPPPRLSTLHHH